MGLRGSTGIMDTEAGESGSWRAVAWYGLGALVLGVLLAKWAWVLFAPRATAIALAPEHGTVAEAGKLFGVATAAASAVEAAAWPDVRLVGVFAGTAGRSGFAVLKLDDKRQAGVAVGENVLPGIRLTEVHPGYVLLEGGGVQRRVNLEEKRK
jgi:general secretion pathway protein C